MNNVFFDLLDDFVVVYLDDILIFSKTYEDHVRHLHAVFKRLQENQLFVRSDKCALLLRSVEFLGHVIDSEGVHVQASKISAVTNWPEPTSINEL